jgi:hypothetical protein
MKMKSLTTIGLLLVTLGIDKMGPAHPWASAAQMEESDPDVAWVQTAPAAALWPVAEGGNGHAYQGVAVGRLISWTSACQAAIQAGGYLATITSPQEDDFIWGVLERDSAVLFVPAEGKYYGPWLGGYQLPGSGEPGDGWIWITGEPFEYTAWCVGEPSQTPWPLNEDRLHYMGHEGPAPTWNDQPDLLYFGPMACMVEYDPVTLEAEDATALFGAGIEGTASGYSGTGYVQLKAQGIGGIVWIVHMGMGSPKDILLRYANGTSHDVSVQVLVNGAQVESDLCFGPTGAWDTWQSKSVKTDLCPGENVVEVLSLADSGGLCIDRMTVFDDNTNLALNRRVASSGADPAGPASCAADSDARTSWRVGAPPQWLEVDLGEVFPVCRTQLVFMERRIYGYRVEVKAHSDDPYTQVVDRTNNTKAGTWLDPVLDTFQPVPARYVRLSVTRAEGTRMGDVGIAEFRLSAATAGPFPVLLSEVGYRATQVASNVADEGVGLD